MSRSAPNSRRPPGQRSKSRFAWGVSEAVCWTLGLLLVVVYCSARSYGELERRDAIASFALTLLTEDVDASVMPSSPTALLSASEMPNQSLWSASRIRAFAMPAAKVAGGSRPAALMRIPAVDLEVPVYTDTTERNLNRGAGLIEGTAALESDGNTGIAAHRDGYFRALKDVAVGDLIEVETLWRRREYRVIELSIVDPSDTRPLDDTNVAAITLITCYPFYFLGSAPQRYVVRAVIVERESSVVVVLKGK